MASGLRDRLLQRYEATRRPLAPRTQRALLFAAAAIFLAGGWYAIGALDLRWNDVRWQPLLIAGLVGVPLTLLANTLEYVVSARVLRHRVPLLPAARLTALSTAANLLPIPGAFLVRIQGLRSLGSGYGKAFGSTAVVGVVWIAVSALVAGALLALSNDWIAAAVLCAAGLPMIVLAHVWLRRAVTDRTERRNITVLLVAVELFAVAANAGRLVLILMGLGIEATFGQALVLAVSSSLAAAAGILPGGFGLRELIAGIIAPLIGLPASAGFAVTAISRILGILVLSPITAALAVGVPKPPSAPDSTQQEPDGSVTA